ncbi:hypothetical protein QR680_015793 [Steinernema hermaphroditum]|uniref:Uncharacterized protein n=1 Tax=Steinernema hermaphroditum TaxID=289476 RepID=A0AA39H8Z5_9BILA|nr:hypothetical protein QR680_015793 [Steinernema hermaphroditum]
MVIVLCAHLGFSSPTTPDNRCSPTCDHNKICRPAGMNREFKFRCVDPNIWGLFDTACMQLAYPKTFDQLSPVVAVLYCLCWHLCGSSWAAYVFAASTIPPDYYKVMLAEYPNMSQVFSLKLTCLIDKSPQRTVMHYCSYIAFMADALLLPTLFGLCVYFLQNERKTAQISVTTYNLQRKITRNLSIITAVPLFFFTVPCMIMVVGFDIPHDYATVMMESAELLMCSHDLIVSVVTLAIYQAYRRAVKDYTWKCVSFLVPATYRSVAEMMDVPPGPSCRRSTSAASLLNMAADLEAQAASEIVGMFRDVVNTMTHERFSVVDRTLVMCSLKCLIGGYLSFDEYAQNLRRVIGEHPCVSEEARQFVDAALPTLRQRMRAANFFVNDVSVNQEFGVFQHFIDQEGHAVVALFATGMAECMFAIQDNVHVVCQNIINRTHEVQAVNPALTSHEPKIAPRPPGSKVFRNLLVAVNEVSLPTMELSSMIAHLKCLIVGLIESRKFFQTLEPLHAKLAFSFPSIEMVMLPHLLDGAIPSLRRAMEIEDVIVDGCNINRELGVLVHDPHGAPLALLMVGNTESRLGIAEEVRNIVCHLMKSVVRRPRVSPKASNGSSSNGLITAKDAPTASTASARDGKEVDVSIGEDSESVTTKINKTRVSDTKNNNSPSRARRNSVRNRSTVWKERTKPRCSMTGSSQETQVNAMIDSPEELITKCARMFRDVLYTVLDPNNGYDEGVQRTTLSYVKRVISGLMESDMFVVRIGQLLGEGCPFVVEPNSARRIISRMSLFMRDQELVVDGFNLNQEAGVFVHVIDEMGIQRMYVMCEGLIEKAHQIFVDVTDM